MFLKRNAFALACCVIFYFSFVKTETPDVKSKEDINGEEELHNEHTFVALIDIVFTDGSKRTCTGTIIHDHVVITAAHCFYHQSSEVIKPELTASFVVIGSKKMFDSGYEQYLPIERILTHPKFRAWTADLSLVYTFAAMTSDKPGRIIPLAGDKTSNPVDSNVTVFTWGRKSKDVAHNWHISMTSKKPCPLGSAEDFSGDSSHHVTVGISSKRSRGQEKILVPRNQASQKKQIGRPQSRFQKETRQDTDLLHQYSLLQHKVWNKNSEEKPVELRKITSTTNKRLSRYLPFNDVNMEIDTQNGRLEQSTTSVPQATSIGKFGAVHRSRLITSQSHESIYTWKRIYKNWRRHMGTLRNNLTVEIFGFINLAACKKVVEGSNLPSQYVIKNGDVACYTSDDYLITKEDSGAPAIRHGQLVAVTVGGAQSDGDHVGIGMKMSCYCTWIADNLPGGGANINCCKNCCDSKNSE